MAKMKRLMAWKETIPNRPEKTMDTILSEPKRRKSKALTWFTIVKTLI
jgi:hypothetical protein